MSKGEEGGNGDQGLKDKPAEGLCFLLQLRWHTWKVMTKGLA